MIQLIISIIIGIVIAGLIFIMNEDIRETEKGIGSKIAIFIEMFLFITIFSFVASMGIATIASKNSNKWFTKKSETTVEDPAGTYTLCEGTFKYLEQDTAETVCVDKRNVTFVYDVENDKEYIERYEVKSSILVFKSFKNKLIIHLKKA